MRRIVVVVDVQRGLVTEKVVATHIRRICISAYIQELPRKEIAGDVSAVGVSPDEIIRQGLACMNAHDVVDLHYARVTFRTPSLRKLLHLSESGQTYASPCRNHKF